MASGGTEGTELKGKPVILLTTIGAKTGKIRKTPLMRVEHSGEYAVVASLGGAPKHPAWYHNLKDQDVVEVKLGNDIFKARWRQLEGEERARVWQQMAAMYPPFTDYQTKTAREIPVVVLERAA